MLPINGLRTPQHRILSHRNTHNTYSCPLCDTYINMLRLQDNHWLATYIYIVIIIMYNNMLRIIYNNILKTM